MEAVEVGGTELTDLGLADARADVVADKEALSLLSGLPHLAGLHLHPPVEQLGEGGRAGTHVPFRDDLAHQGGAGRLGLAPGSMKYPMPLDLPLSSWRGRARTSNLLIQSQAFCRLNYPPSQPGTECPDRLAPHFHMHGASQASRAGAGVRSEPVAPARRAEAGPGADSQSEVSCRWDELRARPLEHRRRSRLSR